MKHPLTPDDEERGKARRRFETLEAALRQTSARLQQANDELDWKTAFLEAQANSSIDGILVVNPQGEKILQNQRMAGLFKIPPHIAKDRGDQHQLQWVADTTRNPAEFIKQVVYLNAHPEENSRDEIELKDGMILDRYSAPVVGTDGKYYGGIWTFRDITERKRAEAALQSSEERFRNLAENTSDWIWETDEQGHYTYASPRVLDLLGYAPAEVLGKSPLDFMPPEEAARVETLLASAIAAHAPFRDLENINRRKDGHLVVLETSGVPILEATGAWRGYRGIDRDITGRKRAEQALHASEQRYRALVEMARDYILTLSPQGIILSLNPEFFRATGWTGEECLGESYSKFIEAGDLPRAQELFGRAVLGEVLPRFELRLNRRDGGVLPTEFFVTTRVEDGRVVELMGIGRDITERKQAEDGLRSSQQIIEGILNAIPVRVFWKDKNLVYLGCNTIFARDAGFTDPKDLIGKNDYQLGWREHAAMYQADDRQIINGGSPRFNIEEPQTTPEGNIITLLTSKLPLRNSAGEISGLIGTYQDITERKQAEEGLRQRVKLQDQLVHTAATVPGMIYSLRLRPDGSTQMPYASGALSEIFDLQPGDVIENAAPVFALIHPDDLGHVQTTMAGSARTLNPWRDEFRVRHARLGEIWVEGHSVPQREPDGSILWHGFVQDITERKRAAETLEKTSALLVALLQNTNDLIYFKDRESRFVQFSQAMLKHFHLTRPEDLVGRTDFDFHSEEHARPAFEAEQEIIRTGEPMLNVEEKETHRDGRVIWVLTSKMPWRDQAGNIIGTMGISRDITGRKLMEGRLQESQKLETVGKLAGGIAHEFNSILTAIIGQSELLIQDLPAGSPLTENAAEITKAASRAATLTRQLLAYGRKQMLQPEVLNLNQVVAGMDEVLRHLMDTESVTVNLVPAPGPHLVKVDAGQMEQVIINLAMNARDAMPNGGKLTLEITKASFDQDGVGRYPELKPGNYVLLAVSDSGRGMSEAVKARAFEPFFTTKGVGQGMGLGLSTCYGIIKQSGGHISVYSEPGRGTTFKVYLPEVAAPPKVPVQRLDSPDLPRGTETVLLVEDDPALRDMAATLLRRLGYTVLAAANGVEAMSLSHEPDAGHIDLLFTDVVMPHMSGKELADRVRVLYPRTKILFTSAYTENAIVHQGVLDKSVALLQKPFTPSALARKVREMLDQPG